MADIAMRPKTQSRPIELATPAPTRREHSSPVAARFFAATRAEQYALAGVLVAAIGVVDYLTGIDISVAFCYLLPICLLAATQGRTGAIIGSLASVLARVPLIHLARASHHRLATVTWNLLVDLVLFIAIGLTFAAWRAAERRAAAREVQLREDLMATVAHDLKNPLGAVMLSSMRLRQNGDERERKRHVEAIHRAAGKMNALIRDLLDVARFQNGRLFLEVREHDLRSLISESFDLVSTIAEARGVELIIDLAGEAPATLRCDGGRIAQVLSNLLGNAIRYSPRGGKVKVCAGRYADGTVEIAVVDQGPGIDRENIEHVFDRFWQGERASGGSAGLGLPIARSIVEAHGGRIWAEPAPERGSAFRFTLPAL